MPAPSLSPDIRFRNDVQMEHIDAVASYLNEEHGLAVVSTTQANGRVLSSVANFGVMDHPITGNKTVAFVSVGDAARLGHIERGSEVTVTIRRGWNWIGVTGAADTIGPDDLPSEFDAEQLRVLLRNVFTAAGGTHDDWEEYDQAMRADGRVAVFVAPDRIIGNDLD